MAHTKHHILIADDDPHIREVVQFALTKANFTVTEAEDGMETLIKFRAINADLVILDINMPELDGLEVCREIRKTSQTPVLFLSSRDEELDRIIGLEIGGDDYVTKPFSPREIVARVNAILKRTQVTHETSTETPITRGQLTLFPLAYKAHFNNQNAELTSKEFLLLKGLITSPQVVFNRDQIAAFMYPDNVYVNDRTIDSHIRNIRQKFVQLGCHSCIQTVHGIGYQIGDCSDEEEA